MCGVFINDLVHERLPTYRDICIYFLVLVDASKNALSYHRTSSNSIIVYVVAVKFLDL